MIRKIDVLLLLTTTTTIDASRPCNLNNSIVFSSCNLLFSIHFLSMHPKKTHYTLHASRVCSAVQIIKVAHETHFRIRIGFMSCSLTVC